MFFTALYTLNADQAEEQARQRPAHFAHSHSGIVRIVMAGPTLGDDGATTNGGLFVFEAPDLETAQRFSSEDPYTQTGVWELLALRVFDKKVG